ncbi:MAG: 2-oxoacid:acceptor oxidoreductase family protein [Candidatus Melainabacteria bacterium]
MTDHNSPPKKEHLFEGRLCAVGGQGIILGADIMAQAAIFHQGLYAIQSPTYGSQVRGGPTKVDVIIDNTEILYPKARNVKYFMAIAQSSFNKFWYDVADDAIVLLDSNLVTDINDSMKANRTFCRLPVVEMAKKEFRNVLLSNMICLGIIQDVSQVLTKENMLKAIEEKVPPKHLAKNLEAFDMGIALAQKELAGVQRRAVPA